MLHEREEMRTQTRESGRALKDAGDDGSMENEGVLLFVGAAYISFCWVSWTGKMKVNTTYIIN